MKNVWTFLAAIVAVTIILPVGLISAALAEISEKQEEKEHE